jgi:hypothetical protein
MGQELFMDSPFTGLANGYVYVSDVAAIPTDDDIHPWAYVANLWVNFENDLNDPVDGCCGTPMWDSEGGVHAFFRYFTRMIREFLTALHPILSSMRAIR